MLSRNEEIKTKVILCGNIIVLMCISLQTASCSENCTAQYCESQWAAAVSGKKISWNFGLFCQEYCSSYFRKDIKIPGHVFLLNLSTKYDFTRWNVHSEFLPFWSVWDHCLIFTKIQFRVKGWERIVVDMHCTRNCFFFFSLQISSLSKHAELLEDVPKPCCQKPFSTCLLNEWTSNNIQTKTRRAGGNEQPWKWKWKELEQYRGEIWRRKQEVQRVYPGTREK